MIDLLLLRTNNRLLALRESSEISHRIPCGQVPQNIRGSEFRYDHNEEIGFCPSRMRIHRNQLAKTLMHRCVAQITKILFLTPSQGLVKTQETFTSSKKKKNPKMMTLMNWCRLEQIMKKKRKSITKFSERSASTRNL